LLKFVCIYKLYNFYIYLFTYLLTYLLIGNTGNKPESVFSSTWKERPK